MRKNLAFILLQSVLLCSAVLAGPVAPGTDRIDLAGQPPGDTQYAPLLSPDGDTDSLPPRSSGPLSATPFPRAVTSARKIGRVQPRTRAANAIRAPPFTA
ncbi:hypothetical protein [Microbulbifer sp. JSM ZJ756]|uniref:hypothetical protein n=1 Tax=Microbulbifer sp. JSM ZJ756 TaxID=3376191 RepID=UPI0037BA6FFE